MRGMISVTCCLALIAAISTSSLGKVGFRQVTSTHPVAVQRGTTAEVKLRSNFTLDETYRTFIVPSGIDLKFLETKPIEADAMVRSVVAPTQLLHAETSTPAQSQWCMLSAPLRVRSKKSAI